MLWELGTSSALYEEGEELIIDQQKAKVFLEADVTEVGRGLTNYNFAQIMAVKGLNRLVNLTFNLEFFIYQSFLQLLFATSIGLCGFRVCGGKHYCQYPAKSTIIILIL